MQFKRAVGFSLKFLIQFSIGMNSRKQRCVFDGSGVLVVFCANVCVSVWSGFRVGRLVCVWCGVARRVFGQLSVEFVVCVFHGVFNLAVVWFFERLVCRFFVVVVLSCCFGGLSGVWLSVSSGRDVVLLLFRCVWSLFL